MYEYIRPARVFKSCKAMEDAWKYSKTPIVEEHE